MDKRKKENPNQKTLFQSWGDNKQTLKSEDRKTSNNDNNIIEIIDLDDDDEDDGLLAAALEMESIDPQFEKENINHLQNPSRAGKGDVSNSRKPEETKEFEFLPGFDVENGNVWIYPTNFPIRDYQFQIVEEALYKNTLVTLPTGLGKTFIAAVLMYNYYRWYPQGKIIFMAPTKPLVAQQIEACYNIMGIPESHTAQMTGTTSPTKREEMWKNKRVFFLTPQVLQNDLSRGSCCPEDVVLLVFDEAHKALGNHAYCQVVREVSNYTKNFRVLALSATPGDDVKAVQQVMTNLLISHMELRSEDSPDIQPYTHSRTVEKVVVPLGDDIAKIKTHFLKVLEGIVGRLFCNRALWQKDPQRVTKYMLLNGRDQFRKRNLEGYTNGQKGAIEGDFAMGISLYHAYELLHQHGILSFYNFIKAIMDGSKGMVRAKTEIRRNSQFMEVMEGLRESIECPPDETAETSAMFSQFNSPRRRAMHKQAFDPSFKSHPKLLKLEEVIVEHFQKFASDAPSTPTSGCSEGAEIKPVNTRVMIFSQYRDSVGEITAILNKHKPLVRVMSFIGQATTGKSSRGLSQKEQLEVVQRFRRGGYNTLVATCVGEEGLDIGDVDLIVCFDAHASPIRLVQRMGRTGRKRNGRIVVLVSQGKEEQIYKRSLSSKKSIHKAIVQGSKSFELYDDNPRMIPRHLTPSVLKMQMTVGNFVGNSKKKRKSEVTESKSGSITSFLGKPGTSKSPNLSRKDDGFLTYEELLYWQENFKLPDCEAGTTPQNSHRRRSRKSLTDPPVKELSLNEWMAWQNGPSYVHEVTHSRRTEHLIEILEFIELHGENAEGGDDAYDVEMMTFLNEEDLRSPEDDAMIIGDDDDGGGGGDDDDQTDDSIRKTEKSKKKKKTDSNENDGEKKKSNPKKSNKTKSKKSKSVSPARQKAKWKEYLKMFENEDNDFDTGENETKNREEKTDESKVNKRSNDEMPEILDFGFENEDKSVKETKELVLVDNDAGVEEDDDAFEVSSQTFSQLLPSLTPQKVNVLRSRITDITDDHAKDVPLPPSLDSLDEISPFLLDKHSKSCEKEHTQKLHKVKPLSCRRKISQLNEPEIANKKREILGEKLGEKLDGEEKYLMSRSHGSREIEEPPNFDLEFDFGNEVDRIWEIGNEKNGSKELTENSSKTLRKNSLLEEPPELDFENEFKELTDGEENSLGNNVSSTKTNLRVKSQSRNTDFLPKQSDVLVIGDDEDDLEEKPSPRSSKPKEKPGFGAGIVCKNRTSEIFDDNIDMEFGDDSLADGILAELLEEDFEKDNLNKHPKTSKDLQNVSTWTFKKSKEEIKIFSERKDLHSDIKDFENKIIRENHDSKNETAPKKSTLKLNSKEKLCDNSLKKSILKLGVFERNAVNSTNKSCNSDADSEEISDHPTHVEMGVKKFENKSESCSMLAKTNDIPGKSPQRQEDFNFKKPDAVLGNRSMKLNRSANVSPKACRNSIHENAETGRPVVSSSPLRMSLKLNSKSNLMKKQDKRYRELSSCGEFENDYSNLRDIQKDQEQSCSLLKELRTSPCPAEKHPRSFDISRNEIKMKEEDGAHRIDPYDSPILRKPLRERLANRGLEYVLDDIDMRKYNQKDVGTILSDDDSPVVRNKSKSRALPYVAAISPLQESQNSQLRKFEVQEGESPVIRRRSKAKIRDGSVFAIAESDEEFENEDEECKVMKGHGILDEQKARNFSNAKGLHNRNPLVVASDSEEDFLVENKEEYVQGAGGRHAAQRKIVLQNSVKRKRLCSHPPAKKQKRLHANHFLEAEADISGSDIDDFTDDESDRGSEFDSFIDDSTQLTQRTPACKISKNPRSPMDMGVVYRQSLMSPHARNLNFRTPNFRTDKNRYKMDFRRRKNTGSESEAEETHARESDLENELGLDSEGEDFEEDFSEDSIYELDENESPKSVTLEISPQTQNRVRRPLKRAKQKYVLNDSTDEDVITSKNTPLTTSTKCNISSATLQSTQAFNHKKPSTLPSIPPKTNSFIASSSIFMSERSSTVVTKASPTPIDFNNKGRTSEWKINKSSISSSKTPDSSKSGCKARERNSLSSTFDFDWDGNDSDLLEAVERSDIKSSLRTTNSTRNTNKSHTTAQLIQDQEMQDIAFAMTATDDMNFEISAEMPTFSLGLDFFGNEIENKKQQSTLKSNKDQNNSAFSTPKNMSVVKDLIASKQQLLQQKQHEQQLAQQLAQETGKQESKFTKIVPPQRSGESNTRAFCLKSSSEATVEPFKKGIQETTRNPQHSVDNMSGGSTTFGSHSGSGTDGCGNKCIGMDGSSDYTGIGTGKENQTSWGVDSNDRKRNLNSFTSTPVKTAKNIPKAFVSPSQRDRDKMVILVDTKEICNAQVVSSLRRKHNIKAEVCQLIHCDYVVSNRVGVIRKVVSAVANGANASKLVEKMRLMCDLYDRPCLIIEKDRVKPGEKERDWSRSHAYSHTLACIAQTHIKVLFSESQEDTAALLTELASMEAKKKAAIQAPLTLNKDTQQVFRFLMSIPRVSYITALNLCSSLRTLRDLISSTPEDLQTITRQLSQTRATEICNYLKHNFDEAMTGTKKIS